MPRIFMFDAYGTLFDVHSAVQRAGSALGADRDAFSTLWRTKQLEYTWTLTLMEKSKGVDFRALTERSLDFCLARFKVTDPGLRAALLDAYRTLDAYPDVAPALEDLKNDEHRTAIFTNGTTAMIEAAITAAGLSDLIDHVITVESVGRFKPVPAVYANARASVGWPVPQDIVFVSSNRWDVAGAAAAGFTPIWCNRTGQPSEYVGLDPVATVSTLAEIGAIPV